MNELKKEIGIIGLGKMGGNIARRLVEKGWHVQGYDLSEQTTRHLESEGIHGAFSLQELVEGLKMPRVIWLMIPAGKPGDDLLFGNNGLLSLVSSGDTVIDGGNSYFKDSATRAKKMAKKGVSFVDVGFSGGPNGARHGGCLMVGGDEATFKKFEPLFRDLATENGYQFFAGVGAGHFVKMVHNGIEYGMMQALAEGFAVLKKSTYRLDLTRIADVYNHGSVVESRLVEWLYNALREHGQDLGGVSGSVGHLGEGEWTVKTGKEMKVPTPVIEAAFKFRVQSAKKPSFIGKVLSALRGQFGGHNIRQK